MSKNQSFKICKTTILDAFKDRRFLFASVVLHFLIVVLLIYKSPWQDKVSQGNIKPAPILVSIITESGEESLTPEAITKLEPSNDEIRETKLAEEKFIDTSKKVIKETLKPIPIKKKIKTTNKKKSNSHKITSQPKPSVSSGKPMQSMQQAKLVTKGTTTGEISYHNKIRSWLEKHKIYPRRARLKRIQGKVVVNFTFNAQGNIISSHLTSSSGFDILDRAAFETLKAANPLPSIPDSLQQSKMSLSIPFGFYLM